MEPNSNLIEMPSHLKFYNACIEPCDMLIGYCICGATHTKGDWENKIENVEQYLKKWEIFGRFLA